MSNHHNLERKRIHDYERMSPHDLSTLSALVENETYVNRNKRHTLSRGMKICRRRVKQVLGVREEDKRLHDAIQAHRDEDAQRNGPVQIYRSAVPKESFFSNDYDYYGSPFGSGHRSPPAQQATPTRGSGELPEQGTPEDKIIYNDAYDRGKNDFSQMNGYHSAREKTEIAKDGYDDGFFGKPRRHFHMETRHIQQKPSLQQAAAQRHQSRAPEQKTSNPRQERYDFGYANGRSDWMNGSSNRSHVFHDEDEVRGYLAGYDGECPETIPAEPARGSGAAAEKVEALSPHDFYMHWYRTGQEDSRNGTSHTTDTAEKRIPYSAGYWGDPCEPPPQTLPTSRDRGETQSGLTERERYDRGYDKGVKDDLQNRPLNVDQFSDLQEIEGYKDAYYGNVRGTNFVRGKEASEGSESLTEIALFVRGYLAGVAGSAGVDHSSRIENPVERFGYQDGRKYGRKYEIVSISSFEQNLIRETFTRGYTHGIQEADLQDRSDRITCLIEKRGYEIGRASARTSKTIQKPAPEQEKTLTQAEWYNSGYDAGEMDRFQGNQTNEDNAENDIEKNGYRSAFQGLPRAFVRPFTQEYFDKWYEFGKRDKANDKTSRQDRIADMAAQSAYLSGYLGYPKGDDLSHEQAPVAQSDRYEDLPYEEQQYTEGYTLGLMDRRDNEQRCISFANAHLKEGYDDAFGEKPNKFVVAKQESRQQTPDQPEARESEEQRYTKGYNLGQLDRQDDGDRYMAIVSDAVAREGHTHGYQGKPNKFVLVRQESEQTALSQPERVSESDRERYNAWYNSGVIDRDVGDRCTVFPDTMSCLGYNDAYEHKSNRFPITAQGNVSS